MIKKRIRKGHRRGQKSAPPIIFNNPRSSIKPESALDPNIDMCKNSKCTTGVILLEFFFFKIEIFNTPPPHSPPVILTQLGQVMLNWEQSSTTGLGHLRYMPRRVRAPRRGWHEETKGGYTKNFTKVLQERNS